MKLDAFSINVERYSQNHARNWSFGPPYDYPFMWHQILAVCSFVSSQSTHVKHGRMDRQTELGSQDHASIAALQGKNYS